LLPRSEARNADLRQQQEHTKENNVSKRKVTLVQEILHNIRMRISAESFNTNYNNKVLAS